jgi:hypothetical protein
MKTIFFIGICCIVFISSCVSTSSKTVITLRNYYLNDSTTSQEIKTAIQNGIVIIGMCPFQAFAAAGLPGPYMIKQDDTKWSQYTPPPNIINAQCNEPDSSIIELAFRNSTQFNTKKPTYFRVRFIYDRSVLIDQKNFDED